MAMLGVHDHGSRPAGGRGCPGSSGWCAFGREGRFYGQASSAVPVTGPGPLTAETNPLYSLTRLHALTGLHDLAAPRESRSGRGYLAGAPWYQPGRDLDALSRAAVPVQAAEQQFCGQAPEAPDILCDNGDAGAEHVGQFEVVKSDERERVAYPGQHS